MPGRCWFWPGVREITLRDAAQTLGRQTAYAHGLSLLLSLYVLVDTSQAKRVPAATFLREFPDGPTYESYAPLAFPTPYRGPRRPKSCGKPQNLLKWRSHGASNARFAAKRHGSDGQLLAAACDSPRPPLARQAGRCAIPQGSNVVVASREEADTRHNPSGPVDV
jgi:hypothetical protein